MHRLPVVFQPFLVAGPLLASAPNVAIGQTGGSQPRPVMSLTPLPIATPAPVTRPSVPPGGALVNSPFFI